MPNIYHILLWHLFVTVNLLFSSWSFCCHGKTDCLIFQEKSLPAPSVSASSQNRGSFGTYCTHSGSSWPLMSSSFGGKGKMSQQVLETSGPRFPLTLSYSELLHASGPRPGHLGAGDLLGDEVEAL